MVLYFLTKFGILKSWTNIPWPGKFDLGFWQTSKQIYRELQLQYKEKVFRMFQAWNGCPRKMFLYSSTEFGILKTWTNYPWARSFNIGFWKTSKQIHRKLQYKKKVFGEFQYLPRCPRKMVLYSWTKFGILKPWTNIPRPGRFDLGIWQTLKQIYRKLQYREKVFIEFQSFPGFPRKMVLYSLTKFGFLKPRRDMQSLRRFDLCFWETLKLFYRRFKYRENVFGEFQGLPRFPRKMILYSSTKFGILKPWSSIQSLRKFDLGFWQASKQFFSKFQYREKAFEEF